MWNFISLLKGIFKPALYHYNVSSIWKKDIVMMQSWLKTLAKYPFKRLNRTGPTFFLTSNRDNTVFNEKTHSYKVVIFMSLLF